MLNLNPKSALVLAGGALAVFLILRGDIKNVVKATGAAVDPTSDKNIFYKTASAATPTGSLGSWVYDWTHQSSNGG